MFNLKGIATPATPEFLSDIPEHVLELAQDHKRLGNRPCLCQSHNSDLHYEDNTWRVWIIREDPTAYPFIVTIEKFDGDRWEDHALVGYNDQVYPVSEMNMEKLENAMYKDL